MITEQLIKKKFISDTLCRDIGEIYGEQVDTLRRAFTNPRARDMASFLSRRPFAAAGDGLSPVYRMSVRAYLRLLDIRYSNEPSGPLRRTALYNRVVWGKLYRETLPTLRYGLTEDLKREIGGKLRGEGR